jgi:Arc/MetJ-type ribon-helix-helix transcriptional regulator
MVQTKQKTVFTAEPEQLEEIRKVIRSGKYRSTSEFLREAVDEKLQRMRRERLAAQLERYCTEGYACEDRGLEENQAFDRENT